MYKVKAHHEKEEYLEIIKERSNGFDVKITLSDAYLEKTEQHFMPRNLFDMCVRTGYLKKIQQD